MMDGRVLLNVNFPIKVNHPFSATANANHKQRNTTRILFASQRLQCSIKSITTPIN